MRLPVVGRDAFVSAVLFRADLRTYGRVINVAQAPIRDSRRRSPLAERYIAEWPATDELGGP